MDHGNRIEAFILGIGFCLLWSSAFIAGKFAIISAPPLGFLMVRFFFATGLMLLVIKLIRHRQQGRVFNFTWSEIRIGALPGLLNNALYLGLCFTAFKTTDAGVVALIASAMPLVTAVLAGHMDCTAVQKFFAKEKTRHKSASPPLNKYAG